MQYGTLIFMCGLTFEYHLSHWWVNRKTFILQMETIEDVYEMDQQGFEFINVNEFEEWIRVDKDIAKLTRYSTI